MSDKDAIKQMREKIRKALGWQEKVKETSELAVAEEEKRERQKRP